MAEIRVGLDTVWVLIAAFLVVFMQAGFGMLEAGFIRAKNTANILMKNFLDFCMATIFFFAIGYAFMFGEGNGFIGHSGFFLSFGKVANPSNVPLPAFFLFQVAFTGAAATIVAGGMAERMKFTSYLLYSAIVSGVVYPIVGHWVWGGGWLAGIGFADFAGSTVVHTVGGVIAFVGAAILGPRIGKFSKDGTPNAIMGHNIPIAALGTFILWFGWFGFNPGSTLGAGDGKTIAHIALNTNLAAASGGIVAMIFVWLLWKKPDISMTMNGILAGLVAITAPCAMVSYEHAILIGAIGGIVVVLGVIVVEKLKVDDPVGAVAVHGFNGVWGTLAIGLFGAKELASIGETGLANNGLFHGGGLTQLGIQALGSLSTIVFCAVAMGLVFSVIKATVGLRVSRIEELRGLDVGEHGMDSYSEFQIFTTK